MRLRVMDLPLDIADATRFALVFDDIGPGDLDEKSVEAISQFGEDLRASAVLILPARVDIEPMIPLYTGNPQPGAAVQLVSMLRDAVLSRLPGGGA